MPDAITKKIGDLELPASSFLVVPDPRHPSTWALPVRDENGKPDHGRMGAAWAALHEGYRGNVYDGPDKDEALANLIALYKSEKMDLPDEDTKASEPTVSDVHVPAPMGAQRPVRRSPLLRKLVRRIRTRLTRQGALSARDFEEEYRSALGHAGGVASAAQRHSALDGSWQVCPSCEDEDHENCTCPACEADHPEDCMCDAVLDNEAVDSTEPRAHSAWPDTPHVHSASGDVFRLFLPAHFAEASEWIPYLPKPGAFKHPRYGDISITRERNADFVSKFNSGVYQKQVPLDAEHESKLSGAMAWIRRLRQNADGSADANVEWTDRGQKMLAKRRYRYISPEWFDEWMDPHTAEKISNVVIGGALTTRPYFKESSLRPLVAFEHGIYVAGEDTRPVAAETHPESSPIGQEKTAMENEPTQTPAEEKRFAELERQFAELKNERDEAKKAAETAAEELKTASEQARQATERVAAMETANRRQAFAEMASDWHGETEKHVAFMEKLEDGDRAFYVEQQNAITEQIRSSQLFSTVGIAGVEAEDSPLGQLRAAAEQLRASDPSLTAAAAMARATREHPDIYERSLTHA